MRTNSAYRTRLLVGFACLLGSASAAPAARAATIAPITNFGSNPTGIGMYLYTPTNVVAKPPILVGIHACHGKGLDVCNTNNTFAQQADKYGFLMICPSAVSSDFCWDVHSMADLTHNGVGGDAEGIMSAVNYIIQSKGADGNRVFAAGHSSGAMMTNVLLGSYPDVFKAGVAFAGVPFACFAQGSVDRVTGWSTTCATGNVTMTGAQWGALVRAAYPGFTGTRPRIQLWHGTMDEVLAFHNFGEEIKQWTNVFGVSETPTSTENNMPRATWIRTRYADSAGVVQIEAIQETGQLHNLVVDGAEAIRFLGLDGSNPVPVPDAGVGGTVRDGGAVADTGSSDGAPRGDAAGSTGGGTATGGATGTGGARAGTGGSTGSTGGTGGPILATGGNTTAEPSGTGGASTATPGGQDAGATANGGSSGAPSATGSSSGCSCSTGATDRFPPVGLVFVVSLLVVRWRRRHGG